MVAGLLDVPLLDLKIPIHRSFLPDRVVTFLHEADLRVSLFVRNNPICLKGFVPSNFVTVYHALRAITKANLASGNTLCEWGSGFGVVASLASMLEFKACGIEIQRGLVDASQELADDFVLPVEFVHGSFVPTGEIVVEISNAENNTESCKLFNDADNAYN